MIKNRPEYTQEQNELKDIMKNVRGLLDEKEGTLLYKLAKANRNGVIVEIGSWQGRSTIYLAKGSKNGYKSKVYAIDPHRGSGVGKEDETEPIFRQNIKGAAVGKIVVPLVMKSEQAARGWNQRIGLLWIDGAHDYEGVKTDIMLWEPHLEVGGVIAFHDSLSPYFPGVRRAVYECIFKSNRFTHIGFTGSIIFATKTPRSSALASLLKANNLLF